jgi:hypothetical protein
MATVMRPRPAGIASVLVAATLAGGVLFGGGAAVARLSSPSTEKAAVSGSFRPEGSVDYTRGADRPVAPQRPLHTGRAG